MVCFLWKRRHMQWKHLIFQSDQLRLWPSYWDWKAKNNLVCWPKRKLWNLTRLPLCFWVEEQNGVQLMFRRTSAFNRRTLRWKLPKNPLCSFVRCEVCDVPAAWLQKRWHCRCDAAHRWIRQLCFCDWWPNWRMLNRWRTHQQSCGFQHFEEDCLCHLFAVILLLGYLLCVYSTQ